MTDIKGDIMRVEIDTGEKEIRIDEPMNLKQLFDFLNAFLPDGEWHDYSIDIHVINTKYDPITISLEDLSLPFHAKEYEDSGIHNNMIRYGNYSDQNIEEGIKVYSIELE